MSQFVQGSIKPVVVPDAMKFRPIPYADDAPVKSADAQPVEVHAEASPAVEVTSQPANEAPAGAV